MKRFFQEFLEGMSISFRAIRANKMRSILTMLGIIIGVTSVTLMGTAIEGLNQSFTRSIASIGVDVLYVQKFPWLMMSEEDWFDFRNRRDLKMEHNRAIERHATLAESIAPMVGTGGRSIRYRDKVLEGVAVLGTTEQYVQTLGINLLIGRFFTQAEASGSQPVCVLGYSVMEELFPFGNAFGQTIAVMGMKYRIVGVIEKQGSLLGENSLDNRVIIPINRFLKQFGYRRGLTIMVKAPGISMVEETKEELRGVLRTARRLTPSQPDDFAINQQEALTAAFDSISVVIAGVGLFITGLSLFVGGIGIMNIMFVSVTERTKEIGLRKAIGAPKRAILAQFLLESATLTSFGGVIAVAISYPLSLIIDQVMPTSMPLSVVLIGMGVSILVGVISGLLPAYRAARMDPVDALRYE
jgi:putative ABC transport system permease protein